MYFVELSSENKDLNSATLHDVRWVVAEAPHANQGHAVFKAGFGAFALDLPLAPATGYHMKILLGNGLALAATAPLCWTNNT